MDDERWAAACKSANDQAAKDRLKEDKANLTRVMEFFMNEWAESKETHDLNRGLAQVVHMVNDHHKAKIRQMELITFVRRTLLSVDIEDNEELDEISQCLKIWEQELK